MRMLPSDLRPGMMFLNVNKFASSSSLVIAVNSNCDGEFTITFLDHVSKEGDGKVSKSKISVETHDDGMHLFNEPWVQVV